MAITPPRAMDVRASNCFKRPPAIGFAGTVTACNISLTFTALHRPVVTFTKNSAIATFTATYGNNGGYAGSDPGRVRGFNIPYISNQLKGTSTSSAQGIFNFPGDIAHRAAH